MITMTNPGKEDRFKATFTYHKKYFDLEQWVWMFGGWIDQQWIATRIKDEETFAGKVVTMHQTGIVLTFMSDYKHIHFDEWYLRRLK